MSGSLDRVKQQFADRFEQNGDGYVYRANLRACGYRVSASDRDRFVTQFNRRITWSTWGSAGLTILLIVAISWIFIQQSGEVPAAIPWVLTPVAICGCLVPYYWISNAPLRELRQAAPVVQGRSKDEAKRIALARLSWRQIGASVVMTAALLWRVGAKSNLLVGWSRLWLAFAATMVLIAAVAAIRKLRGEHDQRKSD